MVHQIGCFPDTDYWNMDAGETSWYDYDNTDYSWMDDIEWSDEDELPLE